MEESKTQKIEPNENPRSWVIYSSSGDLTSIQRDVDIIFSGYSFYPEVDWGKYDYLPPEGYKVMGAWRHHESKVFAFLLDNPNIVTIKPTIQLLLYAVGEAYEILRLENKIDILKNKLAFNDIRVRETLNVKERLNRVNKKQLYIITAILGIFVAIIDLLVKSQFS